MSHRYVGKLRLDPKDYDYDYTFTTPYAGATRRDGALGAGLPASPDTRRDLT